MAPLTRREFLELCAAGGAGAVLTLTGCDGGAATTTTAASAATTSSARTPTTSAPTTGASSPGAPSYAPAPSPTRETLVAPATGGKSFSGTPMANGDGTFDPTSRNLYSHAFAVQNGPVTGSGGIQRSYLRWTYTLPQSAAATKAAVIVTFDPWSANADLQPDEEGGATAVITPSGMRAPRLDDRGLTLSTPLTI